MSLAHNRFIVATTTSFGSGALLLFLIFCLAASLRGRRRLGGLPTVGPSGIFAFPLGMLVAFFYGHRLVEEGYKKFPVFKLPRYFSWMIVVNGPQYLEDIRKATDDQLSFLAFLNEASQFEYTIGPEIMTDTYHNNVVRGPMTRNIGSRFSDLIDEVDKAMGDILKGASEDWTGLPCHKSVLHIISRISTRFFVGPMLSSNAKYTDIMQKWAVHVAVTGFAIRPLPACLKPMVSRAVFDIKEKTREVEAYIRPILAERLEKSAENDNNDDSNDMIAWLWNAAPAERRNVHDISLRLIFLNVTAIHTTSALLTHVLFNLATYNEYVEPLREEIFHAVQKEGWNKVSMDKMRKLDSFIKESHRLHGGEAVGVVRKAMKDFTFSDGTFIPKGSNLGVASRALNHDERYYPNPKEFQGFRFSDKDPLKWQMTALNPEFMTFGAGRHACPGRFFAVAEVKMVVARILLDYDIKLTDEKAGRPKEKWIAGLFVVPDTNARISLKKRALV
ncbi:cytochrome P450 [Macrolepiota fuliginosa MF-IS2]|uniref:Cytochrome P450 n=1 Tax=Macrolepiota fuliginosa MF-IS2 TaxID=1400762 RepID=A0A9P5X6P2_9AGAR|nr:cytochrome P450 [Macrolepiota fuliginosa MF-IS2]